MRISLSLMALFLLILTENGDRRVVSASASASSPSNSNSNSNTDSTKTEPEPEGVADSTSSRTLVHDPNGYVLFCLCMGRYGNKIDHFLGGMAFAKAVNRTLLLPPFTGYTNQPFTKWFKLETLQQFHRAETAEDFMRQLAPTYWPPEKRLGFCWLPPNHENRACNMKEGSPFGPFWDGLDVEFVGDEIFALDFSDISAWNVAYPPEKFPVLAMRGAPSTFPILPHHRSLHQYLQFTEEITMPGDNYIKSKFGSEKFVAIHLRNGVDWERACMHTAGLTKFMASPQCLSGSQTVTKELCLPSKETVFKLVKDVIKKSNAKFLFVATDKNPMKKELQEELLEQEVRVFHMDPFPPWVDLYIMSKADHFIGNCVSSFTAFVTRARDLENKPTSFWGFD